MSLHLSSSRSSARTLDAFADHFLRFRQLTNLCRSLVRAAFGRGGKGGGVGVLEAFASYAADTNNWRCSLRQVERASFRATLQEWLREKEVETERAGVSGERADNWALAIWYQLKICLIKFSNLKQCRWAFAHLNCAAADGKEEGEEGRRGGSGTKEAPTQN